jgi:hypothetical protein
MQVGNGRIKVGGGVIKVLQGTEPFQEWLFWRKMQDLERGSEKISLLFQVKPQ